jgi:DNA-binding SARP family transcriptional activator
VQLSAVRRVLGGGVIADRSSIRLDLDHVDVDLARFHAAEDDTEIVAAYSGELLPDDRYEAWTDTARADAHVRFVAAADRLLDATSDPDDVAPLAIAVLDADPFHDGAHRALVRAHDEAGRAALAADARRAYAARLEELGLDPGPALEV